MLVNGHPYRTVWIPADDTRCVKIIDQRQLPWELVEERITTAAGMAEAIKDMHVRGAGCIGAAAAAGMYLAALGVDSEGEKQSHLERAAVQLKATRPTAVNLAWAVDRMLRVISHRRTANETIAAAWAEANAIAMEDVASCEAIGHHGLEIIREIAKTKEPGSPVKILTHCNAGWLAFVDVGSATAPIYAAQREGIPVFVWVDETRPRNQGARLTAWELAQQGVSHAVIADNAGGHLMQTGQVDLVITGADRVAANGDVANKIGTYLKALAAQDNHVPFYVAFPSSTFDAKTGEGSQIPIEERDASELVWMDGPDATGTYQQIRLVREGSPCVNPAFDITPARLVTGLITDRGVCPATTDALRHMFPEGF